MTREFDLKQTLQSQVALGVDLAQIALGHTRKSFGLVAEAVGDSWRESSDHLTKASQLASPKASDTLGGLVTMGVRVAERQVKLGKDLLGESAQTLRASSEAYRESQRRLDERKREKSP